MSEEVLGVFQVTKTSCSRKHDLIERSAGNTCLAYAPLKISGKNEVPVEGDLDV